MIFKVTQVIENVTVYWMTYIFDCLLVFHGSYDYFYNDVGLLPLA